MRRILWIVLMLLTIIPPSWALAGVISPARVHQQVGDAYFRSPGDEEWMQVAVNTPLDEGDSVWCPVGSRLEIQLSDGSLVRIDGGSTLDMIAVEEGFTQIHLSSGRMYVHTVGNTRDRTLQIDADDTTVLPANRSRLRIDMLPNSEEDVSILKGSAYVEGNGSRTRVRAGEQIALEEGHNELLALNPPDEWERWNVDRDRDMVRTSPSDSYLPAEIRGYAGELNANGEWVRVPDYGMVWRPTVILADDWAPYRSGRWIWKGDDYVWVSDENWGWVPYHYGRWIVVGGSGWCWVPPGRDDAHWGPGYVGWYRTGDRVGWTPLAPGEIYYGHRSYGRNSVNINVTTVNARNTTVVYRNSRAPGGVTIVPQNDFLRGKTMAHQTGGRNAAPPPAISVGSPRIKPVRESRMPVVKGAPPRVAPPTVKREAPQDLRQRFPRVIPPATSSTPAPAQRTPAPTPGPGTTHSTWDRRNGSPAVPADRTTPAETRKPSTPATPDRERQPGQPAATPAVKAPPAAQAPRQDTPAQNAGQNRKAPAPAQPTGDRPTPAEPRKTTLPVPPDREKQLGRPAATPAVKAPPAVQTPRQDTPAQNTGQNRKAPAPAPAPPKAQPKKVWNVTAPEQKKEEKAAPPAKGRPEERREDQKKQHEQ